MKKIVLVMTLLLTGCSNFAGINWDKELENTHWTASFTDTDYKTRVSQFQLQEHGYTICNRQLVTITRLNQEGVKIMENEGCQGCHPDGGILPSFSLVRKYKDQDPDPHQKE